MFDYQSPKDYKQQILAQNQRIQTLELQNIELKRQIEDYQVNLRINKDNVKELTEYMKNHQAEDYKDQAFKRKKSWWTRTNKNTENRSQLVNTINRLVTENLNLQNEVFRIQEVLELTLQQVAEVRYHSQIKELNRS